MNLRLGLNVLSLFQLGLLFAQKVANSLYGFRMKTGFTLEILQLLFYRENGMEKGITKSKVSQFL